MQPTLMSATQRAVTITPGELTPMNRVITITGIGDQLRPEWPITFTGMRSNRFVQRFPSRLLKKSLAFGDEA